MSNCSLPRSYSTEIMHFYDSVPVSEDSKFFNLSPQFPRCLASDNHLYISPCVSETFTFNEKVVNLAHGIISPSLASKSHLVTNMGTDLQNYIEIDEFTQLANQYLEKGETIPLFWLFDNYAFDLEKISSIPTDWYTVFKYKLDLDSQKLVSYSLAGYIIEHSTELYLLIKLNMFGKEDQKDVLKALFAIEARQRDLALASIGKFCMNRNITPFEVICLFKSLKLSVPKNLEDLLPRMYDYYLLNQKLFESDPSFLPVIVSAIMVLNEPTFKNLPKKDTLEDNLILGKLISSFIAKRIKYSTNYLKRSIDKGQLNDLDKKISKYREKITARIGNKEFSFLNCNLPDYSRLQNNPEDEKIALFHRIICCGYYFDEWSSLQVRIGNCGSMARSFLFIWHVLQIFSTSIDLCHIAHGDHAFIILGLKEYDSWGETAVVCDPWNDNQVYPAKEIFERMQPLNINNCKNYGVKGLPADNPEGQWQPGIVAWDPSHFIVSKMRIEKRAS